MYVVSPRATAKKISKIYIVKKSLNIINFIMYKHYTRKNSLNAKESSKREIEKNKNDMRNRKQKVK